MPDRFDLRSARLNQGLSIRQLSALTGVSPKSIGQFERGEGVYPQSALKLADYFGITVVELFGDTDSSGRAAA